jgi:hypothetical protein
VALAGPSRVWFLFLAGDIFCLVLLGSAGFGYRVHQFPPR